MDMEAVVESPEPAMTTQFPSSLGAVSDAEKSTELTRGETGDELTGGERVDDAIVSLLTGGAEGGGGLVMVELWCLGGV